MVSGADSNKLALSVHSNVDGAVENLVLSYQDQLFSFALRLLRNPMDAQEVTQDTFVRAIRALTIQYDAERCTHLALRPWLYRITRNLALNRSRARRMNPEEPLEPGSDRHETAIRGAGRPPTDHQALEKIEALEQALQHLGSESRELVLLRFMEEMSYADIAAVIGGTEASARAKVFRALRRLRSILSQTEDKYAL